MMLQKHYGNKSYIITVVVAIVVVVNVISATRTMTIKVKDIGKIPTSRVPMPRYAPQETLLPSPPSQLSLSSQAK